MDELEFAQKHLGEFKIKGNEIIPRYCPYCNGGDHRDKDTFALNMEQHAFNCLRGSCGRQGTFRTLLRDFGEEQVKVYQQKAKTSYKAPKPVETVLETGEAEYIRTRGLTDETSKAFGVGVNDRGEVVFPFYETRENFDSNKPTFIKYRPAHKIKKGESKARREKNTKPILFGMHLCSPEHERLYIFEGEFDCMVGYQCSGGYDCVSVPSGCKDFTWIDTCADFIEQYKEIAIIGDNDSAGQEMMQTLTKKLDASVYLPDFSLYEDCKDSNEILFKIGSERVKEIMDTVKVVPVYGVVNISDIGQVDIENMPRHLTGIKALDKMSGGLYMGDLDVWTGKRGEGKSTILTQILLESVKQGYKCCIYSGEIPKNRFKYSLYLQAAGRSACEKTDMSTGRTIQYISKDVSGKIDRWLDGNIWLYDSDIASSDEGDAILTVFEQVYKRYDCRIFLIDNLMTVQTSKKSDDYFQAQADFVIKLRNFAKRFDTCVHLVVHPRKTNGKFVNDSDDIGGLSVISNIACSVFSIRKLKDDEVNENDYDSVLTCLKNRMHGELGKVKMTFNPRNKLFTALGEQETTFPWDRVDNDDEDLEEPPF